MPPNIFDFTASATITEGTLGIGQYAALPNFVTGEENFQLVPINVVDNNDGTYNITEDTSGVRSIVKIAQSKIVNSTSEFGTISGMTEMQVSYTPSSSDGPQTHFDVEHVYTITLGRANSCYFFT